MNSQPKSNQQPYKPTMFWSGLVLVLVPFIVGTGVILFLSQLWHSAETVMKEEQMQNTFIQHLNVAFDRWAEISTCLLAGSMESDPSFNARVATATPVLRKEFIGLHKLAKKLPGRLSVIQRLEELFQDEINTFSHISRFGGDNSDLMAKVSGMPKILARTLKIRTEVRRVLSDELDDLLVFRKKEDRSEQGMEAAANAFIAGTVILALLLVTLFTISINRRMRILINNATHLPRGEPLKVELAGNDELAYLDKVIHEASEELIEAAEHRRSIFGMVAHDMRSPLMAAQSLLELTMEMDQNISPIGKNLLKTSQGNLSAILAHVQALLNVERQQTQEQGDQDSTEATGALQTANPSPVLPTLPAQSSKSIVVQLVSFITRPQLFHQILGLVLAPLVVLLCFLTAIHQQIAHSQDLAAKSRRYSDVRTYSRIAQMDLVRTCAAQGIFLITEHEGMRKLALKIYNQAKEDWIKIDTLYKGDPEWFQKLDALRLMTFGKTEEILKLQRTDSPNKIIETLNRTGEIKSELPQATTIRTEALALLERDKSKLDKAQLEQTQANERLSQILSWSMIGNLFMAMGVLALFTTSLNRRLQILIRNAARLGKRDPLIEVVKGTDELAYLDLIMHQAKAQLDLASQQRSEVMASLAEGMRTPLYEAKSNLHQLIAPESTLFTPGTAGGTPAYEDNELTLSDRSKSQLQRAEGNIARVLKLIDDLLTMETLEAGKIDLEVSECNTTTLVDESLTTVASLAGLKQIQLINECTPVTIKADRSRLAQVLINFLSNSIKFSPQNTKITVNNQMQNSNIRISVKDEGPGMDEETRTRVFEKFFQAQTEERKQGFGLGLAICTLIVQSHGGTLGVESEPGKGSTFWFEIPIKANEGSR